jgi:hypothetical protein
LVVARSTVRALAATERMRHRINELLDEEEDDHG